MENKELIKIEDRSDVEIRLDCFNLAVEIVSQDEVGNVEAIFVLADKIYNWIKING